MMLLHIYRICIVNAQEIRFKYYPECIILWKDPLLSNAEADGQMKHVSFSLVIILAREELADISTQTFYCIKGTFSRKKFLRLSL
jgi:hypothetical protein